MAVIWWPLTHGMIDGLALISVAAAALAASVLTFFSGFGLGTILTPVVALFVPVSVAVAITAVVHGLNSGLRAALVWRHIDWAVWGRFGVPAALAAVPGAWLLAHLADVAPLYQYDLAGQVRTITPVKLMMGGLLVLFATADHLPLIDRWTQRLDRRLWVGGVLSGFFGGLSGHQGAFRMAFVRRVLVDKHQFVATTAAIAAAVDAARVAVYAASFDWALLAPHAALTQTAVVAALIGAVAGSWLLRKIPMASVQIIVLVMLYGIATGLITGLI